MRTDLIQYQASRKVSSVFQPSMLLNMSFLTNGLALLVTIVGYYSPIWREPIFNTGIFALSGAFTNWLAIYMLFEKVPFLYGSGIIPNRFQEFKLGIRQLIMEQFFTEENIDRFFQESSLGEADASPLDLAQLVENIDYDALFAKLLQAVGESALGPMLAMLGGEKALEPLKETFIPKMKETLHEMTKNPSFQSNVKKVLATAIDGRMIIAKVNEIVQKRLDELTPRMVKEIIQEMIRKHLGWLVVWGGVFGGLIGLIASFIS